MLHRDLVMACCSAQLWGSGQLGPQPVQVGPSHASRLPALTRCEHSPGSPADIHVPFATVHEALQLSARLRLPSHISQQREKTEAFVQEVRSAFVLEAPVLLGRLVAGRLLGQAGVRKRAFKQAMGIKLRSNTSQPDC